MTGHKSREQARIVPEQWRPCAFYNGQSAPKIQRSHFDAEMKKKTPNSPLTAKPHYILASFRVSVLSRLTSSLPSLSESTFSLSMA
jgi:hypothetical protein